MLKRILVGVFTLACASSAHATPILVPTTPNDVIGSVIIQPGAPPTVTYDVHLAGAIPFTVATVFETDPASVIGGLVIFDLADPSFPSNTLVLASPTVAEFTTVVLDFTTSAFSGLFWSVAAVGSPLSATITDPALQAMLGPLSVQFLFIDQVDLGNATANAFALTSITATAVPEPASLALLGLGLVAAAARRRWQHR